jgi:acetyl esterase/lipase
VEGNAFADALAAMKLVCGHAKDYNINPERIGIMVF